MNKHWTKTLQNSLICIFQSFLICIFCHCLYKEIHIALISPRYYTLIFYVRSEFLTKIICSSLWGNSNKLLFTYIDFSVEMVAEDKSRFISLIPVASLFPSKIRGRLLFVFLFSLQNKWFQINIFHGEIFYCVFLWFFSYCIDDLFTVTSQ